MKKVITKTVTKTVTKTTVTTIVTGDGEITTNSGSSIGEVVHSWHQEQLSMGALMQTPADPPTFTAGANPSPQLATGEFSLTSNAGPQGNVFAQGPAHGETIWIEHWVAGSVGDLFNGTHFSISDISGQTLNQWLFNLQPAGRTAHADNDYARLQFEYWRTPTAGDIAKLPAHPNPGVATSTYEVILVNNGVPNAQPSGRLYREVHNGPMGQTWADYWLLFDDYQPPNGQMVVKVNPVGPGGHNTLRSFLEQTTQGQVTTNWKYVAVNYNWVKLRDTPEFKAF